MDKSPAATWTFVHANDMHQGSPRSYRFDPARAANWQTGLRQMREIEPDLALIGGDLTMDGYFHPAEFQNFKDDLHTLACPSFVVSGNHDTGNKFTTVQGAWEYDDLAIRVKGD